MDDTLCSSDVSQRCASAPQLGRFCERFQAWRPIWLGREDTNLALKDPANPLKYCTIYKPHLLLCTAPWYGSQGGNLLGGW